MNKKRSAKISSSFYFSEFRDYSKAVEIEQTFFKGLLKARNQIQSIPKNRTIQQALASTVSFLQDKGRQLDIVVSFPVTDPRSKMEMTLQLGTLLSPPKPGSDAQVTHFLCLSNDDSLLAKVHADWDFKPEAKERKPSPHVQMGGRVFPTIAKPNVCWNDKIDKPRLPCLPVCTALLWHWAFLEYQACDQISDFLKAWHWKQLVKQAEADILIPFFSDGEHLMRTRATDGLLNALYFPLNK